MTPLRLRECLYLLGWSQAHLAKIIDVQPRRVRRWADDDEPVPENVADWLEKLGAFHQQNPPPTVLYV
jgi:plasmid maintenance system antidote protein VapI